MINSTVSENKHRLKFQAPRLLLKASRDSNRCNEVEIHFGCQGITFPTSDPSLEGEHTTHSRAAHGLEALVGLKSHLRNPADLNAPEGNFPAPAKELISSTDLYGTWILFMCIFIGFFHLHIYLIDLTKEITGLKEN